MVGTDEYKPGRMDYAPRGSFAILPAARLEPGWNLLGFPEDVVGLVFHDLLLAFGSSIAD